MPQRTRHLDGCRILVVEDDFSSPTTCPLPRSLGAEVIGPAATYHNGLLMLVAGGRIDV
jgi:hypothetical protein